MLCALIVYIEEKRKLFFFIMLDLQIKIYEVMPKSPLLY